MFKWVICTYLLYFGPTASHIHIFNPLSNISLVLQSIVIYCWSWVRKFRHPFLITSLIIWKSTYTVSSAINMFVERYFAVWKEMFHLKWTKGLKNSLSSYKRIWVPSRNEVSSLSKNYILKFLMEWRNAFIIVFINNSNHFNFIVGRTSTINIASLSLCWSITQSRSNACPTVITCTKA